MDQQKRVIENYKEELDGYDQLKQFHEELEEKYKVLNQRYNDDVVYVRNQLQSTTLAHSTEIQELQHKLNETELILKNERIKSQTVQDQYDKLQNYYTGELENINDKYSMELVYYINDYIYKNRNIYEKKIQNLDQM